MPTPTASPQVSSTVGLKNVVIAPLTEDTETSHTYGELQLVAGAIEATITPDNTEDQSAVMDIIYNGVKAGDLTHDATAFRAACEHLLARGAEVLILGCTELPPAFDIYHLDYPNVDPTLELALAAVRAAGCETK